MFVWYPPTMPAKPGTLIVKGMNGPDIRYPSLPSTIVIEPRKKNENTVKRWEMKKRRVSFISNYGSELFNTDYLA